MKKNLTLISLVLGVMLLVSMAGLASAATIFSDDFESDDLSAWTQADNDWHTSSIDPHAGSYAAWTADSGNDDDLRREVSTVGYNNIVLSYWYKIANDIEGEHVYVQWYDGSTWHEVADYTNVDDGSWTFATFGLPSGAINNPYFEIRFRSHYLDNIHHDLFKLDDVVVSGDSISSCSNCDIGIQAPVAGDYYGAVQNDLLIDWSATDCDSSTYRVYSAELNSYSSCEDIPSESWTLLSETDPTTDYFWDISEITEGEYCVKVSNVGCCETTFSGPFYIDNIEPTAEANGATCYCDDSWFTPKCNTISNCVPTGCCEADCVHGVYTCYEGGHVMLDGSHSIDDHTFASVIDSWIWSEISGEEFGEFDSVNYGESGVQYNCIDGTNNVSIELNVTDGAGNSAVDTTIVQILNVAPVCNSVTADETTVPLVDGEATVEFTVDASDVGVNDVLTYTWTFGDGTTETTTEKTISHTYDSADTYSVSVTVFDGEEYASVPCEVTIVNVVIPTDLGVHEVAAFYPLVAEFNDGSANNKFMHGLADLPSETDECTMIDGPENLRVSDLGGENYCTIFWDRSHTANPTNAERGDNFVLFKVTTNEGDIQFYSFNVRVYSWMIDMNEEWNLISIPLTAEEGSQPGEVFDHTELADSIYEIWSYEYNSETDQSEWMCVRLTNSNGGTQCGSATKLETIKPGRAYWVKLESGVESVTAKGMGLSPDELGMQVMSLSVDVPTNDWSLVGRYGIVSSGSGSSRVYGSLHEGTALDSLDKVDNDLHVYTEDFDITHSLENNEGYWLWIEDNAFNNAGYESYAPIDEWFPRNSGLSN